MHKKLSPKHIIYPLFFFSFIVFAQDTQTIIDFSTPQNDDIVLIDKTVEQEAEIKNPIVYIDKNKNFKTAVINNDYEAVLIACEEYCNIDEKIYQGNNAMHLAARFGNLPLYLFLSENSGQYTTNQFGETPLHLAAQAGKLEIIESIFQSQGEKALKDTTKNKQNALFYAFKSSIINPSVPAYLLSKAVPCNNKDDNGQTAMHYAMHSPYNNQFMTYHHAKCNLFTENADTVRPIDLAIQFVLTKMEKEQFKEFDSLNNIEKSS